MLEKGYLEFIDWLNTKPERLKQMIMRSIPDVEDLYGAIGIEDYSWLNDFIGENGAFTQLINEYENNIAESLFVFKVSVVTGGELKDA
jgi:hypothetical protein